MTQERNPLIEPYDYAKGYGDSIEKLKDRPELVEFDRLCFEIFIGTDSGKRLIELLLEKYIIPPIAHLNNPKYEIACVYGEGFKAALLMLRQCAISHSQRIKAETNK